MQLITQRLHRLLATGLAAACLSLAPAVMAQDFVWAPDFPVSSELPEFAAPDQDGNVRTFDDLVGENGLLFMLNRSFDW